MSQPAHLHPFAFPAGFEEEVAGLQGPIAIVGAGGFIGPALERGDL